MPAQCPRCEYDLTGLPAPRCPECGLEFAWEEVARIAPPARIAFERHRGWLRVPAFVATWATVLFAPWVFARQIVRRVSLRSALLFAALCYLLGLLGWLLEPEAEWADFYGWWLVVAIYLPVQTAVLTLLDPSGWRRWLSSYRFWLAAGGYMSAIALVEALFGQPLITWHDPLLLMAWTTGLSPQSLAPVRHTFVLIPELYAQTAVAAVWWTELVLWLAGLGFIYRARLRRRGWSGGWVALWLCAALLAVLALYAGTMQVVILYGWRWM